MKKIMLGIFSFFVFISIANAISASSYVVMDMDSQNVLMGSNIYDERLIASTSKIMTAIIAIEKGNLNDTVKVNEDVLKVTGSSIYIEPGEKIKLKDLIYGLIMRSGNDAAVLIANNISKDMSSFAKLMNKYAAKIGMNDTNFINAHGLEDSSGSGNTSTAYDMALLTSYAMKNKTFRKIFKTKHYVGKSDKKRYTWDNKNKLLRYKYVTGGKTGYTKKAKRTLVSTANINDMNIVIVTLNDPNDFKDHIDLYNIVENNYKKVRVLDKDNFQIVDDSVYIEDTLYIKHNYYVVTNNEKNLSVKYYLFTKNKYQNNDKVGYIKILNKNKVIHNENIYIRKENKNIAVKWFKKLLNN